jgi:prephenate dehydratase
MNVSTAQEIAVAVLGPSTYSEEAAVWLLQQTGWKLIPCKTIADVFESTASGKTDYSVVPVENTFEGSVSLHMDWLVHQVDLPIQAEWTYPIVVNLMALPLANGEVSDMQARLKSIRKVYSHQVTFAQCRRFLKEHLPHVELEAVASNSEGARILRASGDEEVAAIGPVSAASRHSLDILAPAIHDPNNVTRFALAGRNAIPDLRPEGVEPDTWKTTLLLIPGEDFPGGLHQLLSAFAWRRLNLTKIESRPTKRALGTYYFYVDVAEPIDSVLMQGAIEEVRAVGCEVRMMGSYPSYRYPTTV